MCTAVGLSAKKWLLVLSDDARGPGRYTVDAGDKCADSSGDSQAGQGIAKAGNTRARLIMVELGWSWLRDQAESDLSKWFNRRFAYGGKRMRRLGIVALARRPAIALSRYLEHGVIWGLLARHLKDPSL